MLPFMMGAFTMLVGIVVGAAITKSTGSEEVLYLQTGIDMEETPLELLNKDEK